MFTKLIGFLTILTILVLVIGSIFGFAIMIGVGVLDAAYGFGSLSWGSSWILGLCWAILFPSSAAFRSSK